MKLAHLIESLTSDIQVVCSAYGVLLSDVAKPEGKTGLKTMWKLLDIISKNRAYDDSHPGFASGAWKRVLPFDGRDYCFYYADGANDTHVQTLLRHIQKSLA